MKQVTIPKVHEVMDADGELTDPALQSAVLAHGTKLAERLGS